MTHLDDLKREMPSKCKTEWDKDPEIRMEFGNLDSYTAFRIAEEAGAARICRSPIIAPERKKDSMPPVPKPFPSKK
jgi:hypothetical protein